MRLVDGNDAEPYTRSQVKAMYEALSAQGEVYMIEERTTDSEWEAIGDVTLAPHTLPIVLRPDVRGRGVGRLVIQSFIQRAHHLGWAELQVREILPGNIGSATMFRGRLPTTTSPPPAMTLRLED